MSTHFVRILSWLDVNSVVDMLNAGCGTHFPAVKKSQEQFEIKAPDGDVVLAGVRHPSGKFICRLHKEVFQQ
jgi:hypothetical protein